VKEEDVMMIGSPYHYGLNVCARQELHRKIKLQEDRIKELEAKMAQILNYISL
jgi:uncharacterized protein involved in tolerance to divalent cations